MKRAQVYRVVIPPPPPQYKAIFLNFWNQNHCCLCWQTNCQEIKSICFGISCQVLVWGKYNNTWTFCSVIVHLKKWNKETHKVPPLRWLVALHRLFLKADIQAVSDIAAYHRFTWVENVDEEEIVAENLKTKKHKCTDQSLLLRSWDAAMHRLLYAQECRKMCDKKQLKQPETQWSLGISSDTINKSWWARWAEMNKSFLWNPRKLIGEENYFIELKSKTTQRSWWQFWAEDGGICECLMKNF